MSAISLLFTALVVPAAALDLPLCTAKVKDGTLPSLDAVTACQKAARERVFAANFKKRPPEDEIWLAERVDQLQREEVRGYLAAHPELASFSEPETPPGQKTDQEQAGGILEMLTAYFGQAKEKVSGMLGFAPGAAKPGNPGGTAAELEASRSLKSVLESARKSGLDLPRHKTGSLLNPAGTLKKHADEYNKSLNRNLDPSMKKFFGDGKKKP
ncbi:MAG: hypothetical protein CO113_01445 [Elusimicrobia bacterium CG_4_9_14_3_um_filter_62_55]|nr:MAG: hypothetical protein COR54_03695 [Elusimicrobia bacterium CG22_combo_CG10-13_8_21_14_all_63_91]PJA14589.1 MAG: hypothetical protein COX66_12175 [Elusimicrobia bacterium CG_4_10_14_0_2_um_filter_63_34]PJB26829.1 MAG: hypothetical protein CO113_01445 [Elusimicrobia bacterium CG_4_9_14_3_um_filter_62_55]